MNNLDDLIDIVSDRETFLVFVKALIANREEAIRLESEEPSSAYGPDAMGWENGTIESFLESAVAWTEDWIGKEHELPEKASWNSFARFLYSGKYYE